MQLQSKFRKACPEFFQTTPRFIFVFKTDYEIVRISHDYHIPGYFFESRASASFELVIGRSWMISPAALIAHNACFLSPRSRPRVTVEDKAV